MVIVASYVCSLLYYWSVYACYNWDRHLRFVYCNFIVYEMSVITMAMCLGISNIQGSGTCYAGQTRMEITWTTINHYPTYYWSSKLFYHCCKTCLFFIPVYSNGFMQFFNAITSFKLLLVYPNAYVMSYMVLIV